MTDISDSLVLARKSAELLLSGGVVNGLNLEGHAPHLAHNIIAWSLGIEKLTKALDIAESDITALREKLAAAMAIIAGERATVMALRRKVSDAYARGVDAGLERAAAIADTWATDTQRALGNGGPASAIRAMKGGAA